MLHMTCKWTSKAKRVVAQCLCGGIGLVLLSFGCFRLGLSLATTGFVLLILVAFVSLIGSFTTSIVLSISAAGLLNFFFTQPIFSFSVRYPQDLFALVAFLTTSIAITSLTLKVRNVTEETRTALADKIPGLSWSALPDGTRDFFSHRWMEFTGLSVEEARTKGWAEVHPEDKAAIVDKWRVAVTTGEPFEIEARGMSAAGDYRWLLIRAEPLRDKKGAIVRWYGTNNDIEERKRAEEALRQSESQWREVFEHSPLMYFMVDAMGIVLSVNTFGAAQLGYTTSELIGQSVLNVFFEEDRQFVLKNVAVCLETVGQSHSWEVRKIRKNGAVLWVRENAKAVRRTDNQVIVLVACEDITERKRTEDALRESEARFRDYAETSSDWLWETDSDHNFTLVTEHAQLYTTGIAPTSRIGVTRWYHATDVESEPEKWRFHRATLDAHLPFRDFVYHTTRGDGSAIYVKTSGKPFFDAKGNFLGYRGTGTDATTEVRADQAEAALRKVQAELAHVTRVTTLGELTASIAHEVNQPLAGVVSSAHACLNWLASKPANVDKARQSVDRIIRDANRASEVVGRVRSLAKKAPLQKVLLNVNETIQETMVLAHREIEKANVSLTTALAKELPLVWADRVQLQQVILNLMINAVEALNGLGDEPRNLYISTERNGPSRIIVAVRDTGVGLDPRELENIFEAFYTTKRYGLGMGLAVSRSIIEDHGGHLWATTNEPRGAAFQFTLPIGREEVS